MTALTWSAPEDRKFTQGVDRGVLYVDDVGHAWNGLVSVTEQPSGAEANPQYADNILYANLYSAEIFGATVECFYYPEAFDECLGLAEISPGVKANLQSRKGFGMSYRSYVGNAVDPQADEELSLVYGAAAAPSERAKNTINESPELGQLSYTITTTPVPVTDFKPTSKLTLLKSDFDPADWTALEDILYGTVGDDPRLPLPDEVAEILNGTVTDVNLIDEANHPTYDGGTHVITLPAVTGVVWTIDGEAVADGAQPALEVGEAVVVEATPASTSYNLVGDPVWNFQY